MPDEFLPNYVVKDNLILRQARPRNEVLAPGEVLMDMIEVDGLQWAPLTYPRWAEETAKGYTDSVTGLTYWIDDQSIYLRGGKLAMLNTALAAGVINGDTIQTVWDKNDQPHEMKTSDYIALILRMGAYYEQLYATYCP